MFTQTVSFPAAFVAGLLSFFSPCVLPLIPAYFTFITGFSIEELTKEYNSEIRKKVFVCSGVFPGFYFDGRFSFLSRQFDVCV